MRNFKSVEQFSNEEVLEFVQRALSFKQGKAKYNSNKSIANMFFENSTRTKHSFEMAEKHLGMHVLDFDVSKSSVAKGETLYDSVLTMHALGVDVAVIRHEDKNYIDELEKLNIHIVNAGSGSGQHPSQSLLDIMTIYEEFKQFEGLKVAIIGDIIHSRVAMSNMSLLNKLGAEVIFAGPTDYYNTELDAYGKFMSVDEAIEQADVVMMLRIQLERFKDEKVYSKEEYHQNYGLTTERANRLKNNAIIMHPAPVNRDVELADELVECGQSRIVEQMRNGTYMRMAILEWTLEGEFNNETSFN